MSGRFNVLRSIGHDLAHSLASGLSGLTEQYGLDPFEDARRNPDGALKVDFLTGVASGICSAQFSAALAAFRDALPSLCDKHQTSSSAFRQLRAAYIADPMGGRFLVTVEDQAGRLSTDEYSRHGERFRTLDSRGRICRKRDRVAHAGRPAETC